MNTYIFIFYNSDDNEVWSGHEHSETEEEAWDKFLKQEYMDLFQEDYPTLEEFLEEQKDIYVGDLEQTLIIPGIHTPEIK